MSTNVMALVSKSIFDKTARDAKLGDVLPFDRYTSQQKALGGVAKGGRLFLVTVRPPSEALWLVAVLESPRQTDGAWIAAAANRVPVTEISNLRKQIRFESGKGLPTEKGTLGMSLQTVRALCAADVALLEAACAVRPAPVRASAEADVPAAKAPARAPTVAPASSPLASHLSAARSALQNNDRVATLDALLEAWRAHRAPEIANVIDVVSADISRALPAIETRGKDFHERWLATALHARPTDVERLLPGLQSEPYNTLSLRMAAVLDLPADPRWGRAFGPMIDQPPTTSTSNFAAWTNLFKILATLNDVRLRPVLQAGHGIHAGGKTFATRFSALLAEALEHLVDPPPLTRADAGLLDEIATSARRLAQTPPQTIIEAVAAPKAAVDTGKALAGALAALETGKVQEALDRLLEAWATTRAPQVTSAIEQLSAEVARDLPPIGSGNQQQGEWMALEAKGKAADVPRLLASLLEGPVADAETRLARLVRRPPDPRIATFAIRECITWQVGERAVFWQAIFDLLWHHAEWAAFNQLEATWGERMDNSNRRMAIESRRVLPLLRERFAGGEPGLGAEDARTFADIAARLAGLASKRQSARAHDTSTEQALLDAIVSDWKNDGPKLVYADWLTEQGGSRAVHAELIQLQCRRAAGERTADGAAREKALLKDSVPLIGPVAGAVKRSLVKFERGFMVAAGLDEKGCTRVYEQILGHPAWATVRTITMDYVFDGREGALLSHPVMRSLRAVKSGDFPTLAALAAADHPTPLESFEYFDEESKHPLYPAFVDGKSVPHLKALRRQSLSIPEQRLLGGKLFRRLERLTMGWSDFTTVKKWLAALDALNHPLPCLCYIGTYNAYAFELTRDAKGKLARLVVDRPEDRHDMIENLVGQVNDVARRLSYLAVTKRVDRKTVTALDKVAKKAKLKIELSE